MLNDFIKYFKNPYKPFSGWHSWDPTPWNHPWLTKENLLSMRTYSEQQRYFLRKFTSGIDPTNYQFAFCGNIANNLYVRAVPLQKQGLNIQMILHPHDRYIMSHPVWEQYNGILGNEGTDLETLLKNGTELFQKISGIHIYPDSQLWLKKEKLLQQPFLNKHVIKHFFSYMIFMGTYIALQNMDALLCTQALYFGYLSNRPYLATPCGGDLWYEASRGDEYGILQRESFKNAKILLASNPWIYAHGRRYGFKNLIYLPIILDQNIYCPGIGKSRKEWEATSKGTFFILITARLDDYYKGFSYWLEPVSKFLNNFPTARLCVINWGNDQKKFAALIKKFGIENKIIWLPISGKELLRDYLRSATCLIDQFIVGYYGATCIEAMACGLPVIARFEQAQYACMCEDGCPPVLQAESKDDVLNHLLELATSKIKQIAISEKSRAWFLKNHGSEKWLPDYIAVLTATAMHHYLSFAESPLNAPLTQEEKKYHATGLLNAPIFPSYV